MTRPIAFGTALFLCLVSIASAIPDTTRQYKARTTAHDERALKPTASNEDFVATPPPGLHSAISYSNTLSATQVFDRPLADCSDLSDVGTSVAYHTQPFFVSITGTYAIEVTSSTFPDGDSMLFIYRANLDPASPLHNCVIGDDDSGAGYLSLVSADLVAGTQYVAVTTTFGNFIFGDFINRIAGPGNITLGSPSLSFSKTIPTGISSAGPFSYNLTVTNTSSSVQSNIVLTDDLPSPLSYISNDCGGNAHSNHFTAIIASILPGNSRTCNIVARIATGICTAISNTASASFAGNPPLNSTASNLVDAVQDGGFESATGNPLNSPFWTEASTNFNSPLCSESVCGNGSGTATAHSGNTWIWFGGILTTENSSVEQAVIIPSTATALNFYYRLGVCAVGAGAADFVRVRIDGSEVWYRDADSGDCGATEYAQASIPLTPSQTNGASHLIRFESTTGSTGVGSNFSIDDISIANITCSAPTVADLSIALSNNALQDIQVGQRFHYAAIVANTGPADSPGVTAALTLPSGINYVSNTCGATATGNTLHWAIGLLTDGATANCTVTAAVNSPGQMLARATVMVSAIDDPEPANNSAISGFAVLQTLATFSGQSFAILLLLITGIGLFALRDC